MDVTIPIGDRSGRGGAALVGLALLLMAVWGCNSDSREVPEEYQDIAVPGSLLRSPEAVKAGAKLFYVHCSSCHGEDADGQGTIRRQLSSNPVDFTDPAWRAQVTPKWVYYVIHEGRKHTAMAGLKKRLDDEAYWNLTAFVLSVAEK